ncbi:hypothetical protein MJO28_005555 [Puccinia striiformis f. sp. tritici]|uniref:Uncharacterized protein n=1 Tax=Puccinia striiformis f. sp. tritici TaxID=168172 RepID=A0ACC0ELJ0_9BASI|nr:hypothetical protein MJO28_005555 [Puccinia striiformis f. sp. tritici]KAI7960524.1 hypothetical protein MJO29_005592 [Puccinia striiformis f. sp. tritici]KAI9611988.1 hypothetical protein H4Q26_008078 [Puccinia striiformis f. sp. tritici PST-130]
MAALNTRFEQQITLITTHFERQITLLKTDFGQQMAAVNIQLERQTNAEVQYNLQIIGLKRQLEAMARRARMQRQSAHAIIPPELAKQGGPHN